MSKYSRRKFVKGGLMAGTGLALSSLWLPGCADSATTKEGDTETAVASSPKELLFNISLAQWSLHKMLKAGELDNLDFPAFTKSEFDIHAVEYVNQFFKDKAKDETYLSDLKVRCDDNGVESVLIMVDGEGGLGTIDSDELTTAIENHYQWVEAAKFLGCHSIRVNAYGEGSSEDVQKAAIEGLSRLGEFAEPYDINVIVENHGGYSSNGSWLSEVMRQVSMDNVGTLPDFGNFCIERNPDDWTDCLESYDRYLGMEELMPFAKGVSAKSHNFDEAGNETESDFRKMIKIVKEVGYNGYIGVEYEGSELSEIDGVKATKALLEKVREELS